MKFMYSILVSCFLFIGQAYAVSFNLLDATSFSPENVQVQAQSIGVPVGTVIIWTKNAVPDGWLECDGRVVNKTLYPELAALMSNVPNYQDRFLQGKSSKYQINQKIEAGLPNITGHWDNQFGNWFAQSYSGAIYEGMERYSVQVGRNVGAFNTRYFMFDASRSNPIYGKSNIVQPPAVTVKYIIKAE